MANRQAKAFHILLTQYEAAEKSNAAYREELFYQRTLLNAYQNFLINEGYNLPLLSHDDYRAFVQSQWDLAMR